MKMTKLDDTFNIESSIVPEVSTTPEGGCITRKNQLTNVTKDDIEKDYEYTRGNLYSIIEKGQEAINGILELAEDSQMPRAYEVAGQLIKSVGDVTDKLLDSQKKMKDMDEDKSGPKQVTNNSLFVGSTSDLQKMLKEMSKKDNK